MKKQDYALLAQIIKNERGWATTGAVPGPVLVALSAVAILFAEKAHVDKAAFLKACGIS